MTPPRTPDARSPATRSLAARLLPDGLAARFALLLVLALLAAYGVALAVLASERDRLDRAALQGREIERVLALVPALDGTPLPERRRIARAASRRGAEIEVGPEARVAEGPAGARAEAVASRLSEALGGREVRVAPAGPRGRLALSAALVDPPGWLNGTVRAAPMPEAGRGGPALLLILGLSLCAVLAVGIGFVRLLTRPLAALAEAAHRAGHGDRTARVPETGARELREAAGAFNDMQARIARFEAERTRTLAAVGHDLRTPITSLRIRAEMLDEAEAAPMIRTLDEMKVMAEGLLAYARGGGDAESTVPVDLAPLLERLCEERGAAFEARAGGTVRGRPVALGRAAGNLVDNALRYAGGARVTLSREGGEAVIAVEDRGPGIPEERLGDVLEPFVRGEASRSADTGGAGLGLSIARTVAQAHGGTLTLSNREGGGLRAALRLPLAR